MLIKAEKVVQDALDMEKDLRLRNMGGGIERGIQRAKRAKATPRVETP
jgi:hypothetical protein